MKIYPPNGGFTRLNTIALHPRRERDRRAYSRPTDWLASAGYDTAWGRTRREAISNLMARLNASFDKPPTGNVIQYRR